MVLTTLSNDRFGITTSLCGEVAGKSTSHPGPRILAGRWHFLTLLHVMASQQAPEILRTKLSFFDHHGERIKAPNLKPTLGPLL